MKGKRWKRGEEEKGWKENEIWKKRGKEGEGEERRGRERRLKNRESSIRSLSPPPDAFPSAKLENNMTPIKRRLRKNTTPISRSPTKLKEDLQVDPRRRRSNFDVSSCADFSYTPDKAESPKYGLQSNRTAIYKATKAHGNS